MAAQAACGSNCLFYSVYARPRAAPGRALSLASQLPPRSLQPSVWAWLRKQLVGATVFSTRYMPDRVRRLAGPYRWQASSHPDLCSRRPGHGCASSLWEQLSFLLGICPTACGAWQGPIAGKPAPTQISAAVGLGMAAQAACGSNYLFYSVYARPRAAPGRALSRASPLHPGLCSHQCNHGCASSLWERACPRLRPVRHRLNTNRLRWAAKRPQKSISDTATDHP
jgi:hypothetical protein